MCDFSSDNGLPVLDNGFRRMEVFLSTVQGLSF